MISDAIDGGLVSRGGSVIESSSGNLGVGLAQACRYHGLRLICVVDVRAHETNMRAMRALGAEVRVVTEPDPETDDLLSARLKLVAELVQEIPGSFWPNQYANRSNPAAHAAGTMREIDEALDGDLDYLFVATSTTGTLRGCRDYLRANDRETRVVAVDAVGSALFGGARGTRRLPGFGAGVEAPCRWTRTSTSSCASPTSTAWSAAVDSPSARRSSPERPPAAFSSRSRTWPSRCRPAAAAPRSSRTAAPAIWRRSTTTGGSSASSGATLRPSARSPTARGSDTPPAVAIVPRISDDEPRGLRVAIVGVGPKGLFALERLLDHARASNGRARLEIDLFEPHPVPGAGPVYDPGQPEYLRMNFAAGQLNMWWPGGGSVRAADRLSFAAWRKHHREHPRDRYPPRAQVGRYLADGYRRLVLDPPPGAVVQMHRESVQRIHREGGWTIASSAAGERRARRYDEVLIATGHHDLEAAGPGGVWEHAAPLIPAVFPVERRLTDEHVAPGATVAVRGFALTFIDAALALTEGRGGRFEPLAHPYRLAYRPGEHQARAILPFARVGRPMLAKPEPAMIARIPGLEEIAQGGRELIATMPEDMELERDLLPILACVAASSLREASPGVVTDRSQRRDARRLLGSLIAASRGVGARADVSPRRDRALAGDRRRPSRPRSGVGARPRLARALPRARRAAGRRWPAAWCLARVPAPGREMERVAFGPPPQNAAKLLALIDAGVVDLSHVSGGRLRARGEATELRSRRRSSAVDVVIDAVLCRRAGSATGDLLAGLIAGGHARLRRRRRRGDRGRRQLPSAPTGR